MITKFISDNPVDLSTIIDAIRRKSFSPIKIVIISPAYVLSKRLLKEISKYYDAQHLDGDGVTVKLFDGTILEAVPLSRLRGKTYNYIVVYEPESFPADKLKEVLCLRQH